MRSIVVEGSSETHSSSSKKGDAGTRSTNSGQAPSAMTSSSSVTPVSVPGSASSSSRHSGPDPESSSSSEYVPFDHSKTLAEDWRIGENRYKQFTDPRNGRSYYYITVYSAYKGYSVTVMAENLNIGEMVLGKDDQKDDTKIETLLLQ